MMDTKLDTDFAAEDTIAPSDPEGLTAVFNPENNKLVIMWDTSKGNIGVVGYKIYRDGTLIDTSAFLTHTETGLTPDTLYCYEVSAFDANENESNKSIEICVITDTEPDTPLPPTELTGIASGSDSISLSWRTPMDDSTVAEYNIYNDDTLITTVKSGTTYSHIGLSAETQYCYTVSARLINCQPKFR